jgi:hypothetical protein
VGHDSKERRLGLGALHCHPAYVPQPVDVLGVTEEAHISCCAKMLALAARMEN